MRQFAGQPIMAAPRPTLRQRLGSAAVSFLVAAPVAAAVYVVTASTDLALAIVAGATIAGGLRPLAVRGGIHRDIVITWGFVAALVTASLYVAADLDGGGYYPRLDGEPLLYLFFWVIGVVVFGVILWVPMGALGLVTAVISPWIARALGVDPR